MTGLVINEMKPQDWESVRAIYEEGIRGRNATFTTEVPNWTEWDNAHHTTCRFVARIDNALVGWAAISPTSKRDVYRGVAESSVYITSFAQGKGVGSALMQKLIEESESEGFWTLQTSIFPENKASIALHEKLGFRIIGVREKVSCLDGIWRDTVMLERRSKVVGV